MIRIAILGFGVVGHGVADLLEKNEKQVLALGGEPIRIAHILDLRDFPDSPYADRVTHCFDTILKDPTVSTIIEVMGGSHPAYEYTVAALRAGKNVITSNKEVVAAYGAQFLALAAQMGVVYRFEAAVGGGIPVISPLMCMLGQNRIREVRGILNGTTNYILTKMFTFGDSFEHALSDAQEKGYAERNPDADILGTDACRKIAILAALVCGKAIPPEQIPTEGITHVRAADVRHAGAIGYAIRLLGRARFSDDGKVDIRVCPTLVGPQSPLCTVSGVYNAVEVLADPLDNVMFYGKGAGAGATASAVVGDLMLTLREGIHYAVPTFTPAGSADLADPDRFPTPYYIAMEGEKLPEKFFPVQKHIPTDDKECAFLSAPMRASDLHAARIRAQAAGCTLLSVFPTL